jgi:hypothetical protein
MMTCHQRYQRRSPVDVECQLFDELWPVDFRFSQRMQRQQAVADCDDGFACKRVSARVTIESKATPNTNPCNVSLPPSKFTCLLSNCAGALNLPPPALQAGSQTTGIGLHYTKMCSCSAGHESTWRCNGALARARDRHADKVLACGRGAQAGCGRRAIAATTGVMEGDMTSNACTSKHPAHEHKRGVEKAVRGRIALLMVMMMMMAAMVMAMIWLQQISMFERIPNKEGIHARKKRPRWQQRAERWCWCCMVTRQMKTHS